MFKPITLLQLPCSLNGRTSVEAPVILKFLFPSRSRHKARAGIGFLPCTSFAEKQTLKQHRTARPLQFHLKQISI